MPSELRYRHGRHDRQGNEGSCTGYSLPAWRPVGEGYRQGQRCGAREILDGRWNGALPDEELRSVPVADALQVDGPVEEVRQELSRDRKGLRESWSGPHD